FIRAGFFGFLCAALLALGAGPARAEGAWLRAETPHFVIYSGTTQERLRDAAAKLESFDAVLRQIVRPIDSPAKGKLEIYLFRDFKTMQIVWPRAGAGVGGFYTTSPDFIGAFALYRFDLGVAAHEILFHEYAHHFMLQHFAGGYPPWFVEGFAEY